VIYKADRLPPYQRFVYWALVSAYTDISVRASAIKNQRCCSARKAAPVLEHALELLAFRGLLVEHLLERGAQRL
jgi:hypothetical protein